MRIKKGNIFFGIGFIAVLALLLMNRRLENRIAIYSKALGNRTRELNHTETTPIPGIPRIIHFIWNSEAVPNEFSGNVRSFVKNHPAPRWEYYFWTKETGLQFIKERYSFLYQRLATRLIASGITRANVLRYLIIHEYGGFYFDLDTISVKPMDDFAANHQCSVVTEPDEHYLLWKLDFMLSNAALMCVPQHPFYKRIISELPHIKPDCKNTVRCSGPLFITDIYNTDNQTSETRSQLPDLQSSEIFQDAYDVKGLAGLLNQNCLKTTNLSPQKVAICDKWKARGMDKRNVSSMAITYHTWFHTVMRPVSYSKENTIFNIIPHVKIYGLNLHG